MLGSAKHLFRKGVKTLFLQTVHKDDIATLGKVSNPLDFDVDDILKIREIDNYYISLTPAASSILATPVSAYIKLDQFLAT